MLPKIMHHCAFLIITFSCSYILCIQNGGKTVSSSYSSSSSSSSSSETSESVDKLMKRRHFDFPEARQTFFQENNFDTSGFQPSNELTGFRFPDKHQHNTNSPNELLPSLSSSSSFGYHQQNRPYPNNNREVVANINEGANPYNLALNTGEHSANNANANNLNNNPYQQHSNAIAGFGHHRQRDSPKVPNANDFYLSQSPSPLYHQNLNNKNPYYHHFPSPQQYYDYEPIQRKPPTYAQAFGNYLFNGQPNYNRPRATPPPRPPRPPPPSALGSQSSYSPYQDGHLTGPYPYDDLTSPSGPSSYPPPQYANQFGNFGSGSAGGGGSGGGSGGGYVTPTTTTTGSANPLGSLLNSIGGPFAGGNPLSMQIIRGLENIARNDDLQCVPKVLCQMLGSPTRRAQLPSFITSPVLTRFVASLPSFSPALIYGRAALLGLSGGEYSCTRTYNKCPQNEDDILYYLNNHRGGFFKFFSEPDDTHQDAQTQSQNTQYQYTTQPPSSSYQQQSLEPSIFNFLKGLTSPSWTTSPTTTTTNTNQGNVNSFMSDAVTNGIGSLFGNIISGFLNGQGAATRRNDDEDDIDFDIDVDEKPKKYSDLIESNSTTTTTSTSDPDADGDDDEQQVEGRILNNKSNILAYAEPPVQHDNPISFPPENGNDNYESQQFGSEFRFPKTAHRDTPTRGDDGDYRRGKKVSFIDSHRQQDDSSRPSYGATKMIFPDRTGTGNLRFDNDEYFRVGKILNRRPPDYNRGFREQENYYSRTTTTTTTRRPTNYSGNFNRYSSSNYYRQDYNQNRYQNPNQNQGNAEDTSGNVYVTNGQGVIEYYINASGKKIYV